MYKLIAMDMDGTLLNSYGKVSLENKQAIKQALEKNIEVVLASGRIPEAIIPYAEEIEANKYLISGNGAQIYDIQNKKIIYSNYLSKEKVLETIEVCEKNSMFYSIFTNNTILTKSINYNVLFYLNENKKNPESKQININVLDDIYSYVKEYQDEDFLKITICDNNEFVFKGIMNKLKTIKNIDILEVETMSRKEITKGSNKYEIEYYYLEITKENVNKWEAIKTLIKMLGIKQEEVIAIGDNMNDIEMINGAGLGIALGNSSPRVKEYANKVVASNDENGVAQAILENLN